MKTKINEDFITIISRLVRPPVDLLQSYLLIVEDDIWYPNFFWADMDSIDTSILVFVPYEEGVVPLLQVY